MDAAKKEQGKLRGGKEELKKKLANENSILHVLAL
jgi:hypothetical protein